MGDLSSSLELLASAASMTRQATSTSATRPATTRRPDAGYLTDYDPHHGHRLIEDGCSRPGAASSSHRPPTQERRFGRRELRFGGPDPHRDQLSAHGQEQRQAPSRSTPSGARHGPRPVGRQLPGELLGPAPGPRTPWVSPRSSTTPCSQLRPDAEAAPAASSSGRDARSPPRSRAALHPSPHPPRGLGGTSSCTTAQFST